MFNKKIHREHKYMNVLTLHVPIKYLFSYSWISYIFDGLIHALCDVSSNPVRSYILILKNHQYTFLKIITNLNLVSFKLYLTRSLASTISQSQNCRAHNDKIESSRKQTNLQPNVKVKYKIVLLNNLQEVQHSSHLSLVCLVWVPPLTYKIPPIFTKDSKVFFLKYKIFQLKIYNAFKITQVIQPTDEGTYLMIEPWLNRIVVESILYFLILYNILIHRIIYN